MGSFSIWHWLIVLLVIVLVFGTGKLRNIGKDLGGAVKGFKEGIKEAESADESDSRQQQLSADNTIDVEIKEKTGQHRS